MDYSPSTGAKMKVLASGNGAGDAESAPSIRKAKAGGDCSELAVKTGSRTHSLRSDLWRSDSSLVIIMSLILQTAFEARLFRQLRLY